MKRTRLWAGLAAVLAACAGLCGCSMFSGPYTGLPANSGKLSPLSPCSLPTNANAYLELDVGNPNELITVGNAWILTRHRGWIHTPLLHIKLIIIDTNLSQLRWSADVPDVDWMGAAYQGRFGSGQVNTLMPEHSSSQPFTQQTVKRAVAGQRYAIYASLPLDSVNDIGCMAPNGVHPFLSL